MRGTREDFAGFTEEVFKPGSINGRAKTMQPPIKATPFVFRDPGRIPPRQFLYGRHLSRGVLSCTVSAGGVGKSSLALVDALAMTSGRDLIGNKPARKLRVWYWNGEDPPEEIERRIAAIRIHYDLKPAELDGNLFVNSGRDTEIILATEDRSGIKIATPIVAGLKLTILENKIDVFIIDPLVASHSVAENDNGKINAVCQQYSKIAHATNSAGELYHHVRKGQSGQGEFTVEDGRGAVALRDAVRSARVLNVMSKEEAKDAGIEERQRRSYFRVDNGKANLTAPPSKTDWRHIVSVRLGNATDTDPEDEIGVVTSWAWPNPFDGLTPADLLAAQKEVSAGGPWRLHAQAKDWVGLPIAKALNLNLEAKSNMAKVKGMLKGWIETGMFVVVEKRDEKRREKKEFVEIGEWASAQP
jgi:hypothetical protein